MVSTPNEKTPAAPERAAGSSTPASARRKRSLAGPAVILTVAAFSVGAYVGSDGAIASKLLRGLAALGAPQYQAYQDLYVEPDEGRSDYLLFYHAGAAAQSAPYFAARPELEIVDKTIFSNAVVLSVPAPAGPWVDDLKAQPFVWMLLKDRPLFFCH